MVEFILNYSLPFIALFCMRCKENSERIKVQYKVKYVYYFISVHFGTFIIYFFFSRSTLSHSLFPFMFGKFKQNFEL